MLPEVEGVKKERGARKYALTAHFHGETLEKREPRLSFVARVVHERRILKVNKK